LNNFSIDAYIEYSEFNSRKVTAMHLLPFLFLFLF